MFQVHTMAVFKTNNEFNAILLIGIALISSYGVEGSLYGRRGLVDTGATATVFDVTTHGAKADDKTDNAMAFIQTWNAACASSGAPKVVIPKGTFRAGPVIFQGPCNNTEPIVVEVQGIVKATTDISEYASPEWILFEQIDGLVVNGGGTFDGQGLAVWKYDDSGHDKNSEPLPVSLKLHRVNNSVIEDISSVDSKGFHMFLTFCEKSSIRNLKITAPGDSPNTDGIHLSGSNLVEISSSVIGTGDDCISIGQGTTNLTVSNIICGPGHGISVGSLGKYPDELDVRGIVVSNCTLSNTTNGVRIKTWSGSKPSEASGILFEDIIMNDVQNPIIIDQAYGSEKNNQPSSVKISDVHYKNIKGTSASVAPVSLMCSELVPCNGVEMVDIDLTYAGPAIKQGLTFRSECLHAGVVFGGIQNPPACAL